MTTESEIVRAKVSFRAGAAMIQKGDLFDVDSDVVQGRENLFIPAGGAVRTTSTVPAPVTEPPPFLKPEAGSDDESGQADDSLERPRKSASKAIWAAYLAALGYEGDTAGKKRDELVAIADELESAGEGG